MKATLTIYKMAGEIPYIVKKVELEGNKFHLLDVLKAVRDGLPADCAASLVEPNGKNVK